MQLHGQAALVVIDGVGGSTVTAHDAALDAMAYLQRDCLVEQHDVLAALDAIRPTAVVAPS